MNEYLEKRFSEAIWESELAPLLLHDMEEADADRVVNALVTRLLVEVGE